MAQKLYLKTGPSSTWSEAKNLFVKVSTATWSSVTDAWVKVSPYTWMKFLASATNPDTPLEIITSYDSSERLRIQGKNYHWTPTPATLYYTFTYVNDLGTTKTLTSSTSTTNPASGSSITVPGTTTYRTISKALVDDEFTVGGLSTYKFNVTGTTTSGTSSTSSVEYQMLTPKAPTLSVEKLSNTSVKVTITANSTADFLATGQYIVSTWDQVAGTIETGGGRGQVSATFNPATFTLTGLTAGRLYYIYVSPFTGTTGTTEANATGYPGAGASITTQSEADYTFAFGNTLHIGTNGYISLDTGSTSDSINSTTGRVIGIFPGDLYQDTATSIWYWSDTTRFVIRWEGYHYNQPSNLRQYEIVFNINNNYASVYAINVSNTSEGTDAYVKNGVTKTNYAAALGTGSWRYVYFDGVTNPTSQFGPYITTSKSVMKQVAGLTSGTQDVGYTSIATSTNQSVTPALGTFDVSSFTKGTVGSSSQGASRSTTLSWGASTGASAYQVQYFGSNDNVNWTTVQAFSSSNNISTTSDTKAWSTSGGNFSYYTYMKASVRSLESTGTATYVYSNSGAYTEASGVAPGQPSFGTITKTGSTASIPFTVGTQGTNYLYTSIEYMYRTSSGSYPSTWATSVITSGAGTISLTGLSASTTYYIKIRTINYDELYSLENETNFTTTAGVSIPTSLSTSINASNQIVLTFSGGSGDQYDVFYANSNTRPTDGQSTADYPNVTSPYIPTLLNSRNITRWFWVRTSSGTTRSNWFPTSPAVVTARIPLFAPPAPVITNSAQTTTSLSWYWSQPTPLSASEDEPTSWDYAISTSANTPTSWTNTTTRPTSAAPITTSSLSSGTTYYMHVRAKNADNSTNTYNSGTTSTATTAPTSFTSSTTYDDKITLDWSGGSGTSYEFFWTLSNTTTPGTTADFTTTNASTYDWIPSGRGTTYYLYIRAATGTTKSSWFPTSAPGRTGRRITLAPPAPTITNSATASTSLSWYWDSPTPTSTQDYPSSWDYAQTTSSTSPTSGWTNLTTRPTSTSPLVISSLSSSTDYYLHVKAKNADASVLATPVKATTSAAAVVAPTTPSAPTVGTLAYSHGTGTLSGNDLATSLTRVSNTAKTQAWTYSAQVDFPITWVKPSGATDFEIYVNNTGTAPASSTNGNVTTAAGNVTTFTYSTTQSNRGTLTRYFYVKAKNSAGSSGWSSASTAKITTATAVSALAIRLYRGNGTTFSSPSAAPAATDLSYAWTGITDRGNPNVSPFTAEGHYATVNGMTIAGTNDTATSSTV
jgi:hypothetical protein